MTFIYHTTNSKGELQINASSTFIDAYNFFCKTYTDPIPDFDVFLEYCKGLVKTENPLVKDNALNNTRGSWYQWLVALCWKKYVLSNPDEKRTLLKLPNKKTLKWHRLYVLRIQNLIDDLEHKLAKMGITLETSNPDFIFLESDGKANQYVLPISDSLLTNIDSEFKFFEGKCEFNSMSCFLSIKTSLRPDRRLQTQHESTMIKALVAYISTRNWDMSNLRINFVVLVNTTPSKEDINSLSAIAAHSLVTPLVVPQKSVDLLTTVKDETTALHLFKTI